MSAAEALTHTANDFAISPKQFAAFRRVAEGHLGISMPESKRTMLEARLVRRLRQLSMTTAEEYLRYLSSDEGQSKELSNFLDLVTTNKTSFFRELPQLNFLQQDILPTLLERAAKAGRPLRVWSAACSTGQEVWTLVMMLERARQERSIHADYSVWGSDVSGRVLATAVAAKYPSAELDDVDAYHRGKFFMRSKDPSLHVVRVRPEYRIKGSFFHQNLMEQRYNLPEAADLVLLRNALIYFPRENQTTIINQVARYLAPGGLFAVGLTESLHGMAVPFNHLGQSVYQLHGAR